MRSLLAKMSFLLKVLIVGIVMNPALLYSQISAEAVAQKVYDRNDGRSSISTVTMKLAPQDGRTRERKMEIFAKDYGEITKRLIIFVTPKSIADTSFLTLEQHEDRDVQFLYLPSLRRVRRIASDQKDRSFVNSDFSYEDLERRKVEFDTYRLLPDNQVLGKPVWVLERTPKDPSTSQYARSILWVAKDSALVLKAEMYENASDVHKRLEVQQIEKVDNIWTAMQVTMHDLKREHKTTNTIEKIRYNIDVGDEIFTKSYMERR